MSSQYHHPGGGRGPIGGLWHVSAAIRYCDLSNWAPAFAGVVFLLGGVLFLVWVRYSSIPSLGAAQVIAAYSAIVSTHPATSDAQNGAPCRSIAGISRNIGSDGSTYQKVAPACAAIVRGSGLSRQS